MKDVKLLLETGQISDDVIMMVDEIHTFKKCALYSGGYYFEVMMRENTYIKVL